MVTSQSPTPNAYTLAVSGRRPFVVVHSALLELLTPLEVQSVLGHELGHLKVGASPSPAMCLLALSVICLCDMSMASRSAEVPARWRCTAGCPAAACTTSPLHCADVAAAVACHDHRNTCSIRMHVRCALLARSASTACG